jgi:hypothetical protein
MELLNAIANYQGLNSAKPACSSKRENLLFYMRVRAHFSEEKWEMSRFFRLLYSREVAGL